MSENIFFNPGDSIASDFDFNKAYVSAQIYRHKTEKPVLIVQEKMVAHISFSMKTPRLSRKRMKQRSSRLSKNLAGETSIISIRGSWLLLHKIRSVNHQSQTKKDFSISEKSFWYISINAYQSDILQAEPSTRKQIFCLEMNQ